MNPDDYHLEFFEDGDGSMPVEDWLEDLSENEPAKWDAVIYALSEILARKGIDVCETEFGKPLGKGLFAFRLRHTRDELQAMYGPPGSAGTSTDASAEPVKVLMRVFFSVHGDKIVLLLGGYDKARDPSSKRQSREIATARARLKADQARRAAEAKAAKRAGNRARDDSLPLAADKRVPAGRSFLHWFRRQRRHDSRLKR